MQHYCRVDQAIIKWLPITFLYDPLQATEAKRVDRNECYRSRHKSAGAYVKVFDDL